MMRLQWKALSDEALPTSTFRQCCLGLILEAERKFRA